MASQYAPKVFHDYLAGVLGAGVRVATQIPKTVPAKLVTIAAAPTGGHDKPEIFVWHRLVFRVRVGRDEVAAGELCHDVRNAVARSPRAGIGVHKVRVIGEPGLLYDPDDSTPIVQTTIDVLMAVKR